jgi:hypothetical protein
VIAAIYARSGVRVTFRLRTLTVAGHVLLVAICLWAVESASGGDPVTIRVLDPQGLEAGILSFPDRDDVGTGTFETNIPPGALATDPFVRVAAAAPADGSPGEFQITAATSLSKRLVTVGTTPTAAHRASLPRCGVPATGL